MVKTLYLVNLKIPFRLNFKHNSAERKETEAIIVIAGDGIYKGTGEGCPRKYVTAESPATAAVFFDTIKDSIVKEVHDIASLKLFHECNISSIKNNHAAWCAIELALIDLFAKQKLCSAEKLLNVPELDGEFKYTGVIGDGDLEYFTGIAKKHLQMGFTDFKIKISGDATTDYKKISVLKELCRECAIRLDANNCWDTIQRVVDYVNTLPCEIIGLEEPLADKNIDSLIELSPKIKTPIILDESFTRFEELKKIKQHKEHFIINLRVSKMGGIINSLQIVEFCKKEGIRIIIGAQVGETSILTRAALLIANAIKPNYIGLEGGYGTLLLEHDIVDKPLMFSECGILKPHDILNKEVNGFQLKINIGL